jgi:class 3 adenylate cyclase/pimeloyl-ACP methyl ester carboxylesterase
MDVPEVHFTKTSDGVNIAYQTLGRGPDLVFHLGWPSQLLILWEHPAVARFFTRLASFSRLILFDPRGNGLSDRGPMPLTFEGWAEDITAVLDAAGSMQCAHFGCNFGGRVALMYTATYPARTSVVATFGAHPATLRDEDYPWGTTRESLEMVVQMVKANEGQDRREVMFQSVAPGLSNDRSGAVWWSRLFMSALSANENVSQIWSFMEFDIRQLLESVRAPTVLMHRSGDRMTDPRASQYMAERISGAKLIEYPGDDHLPFFEGSEQILADLEELITGNRRAADADRVLATVMFTDIVDSTPTAARLGDERWTGVLQQHNRIVDDELRQHRGKKIKTTGDGLLATFDGPARGVRCAQAICEAVRPLGVEVRAGLHAGEIELLGNDIGGIAVHIGQRVSSLAGPGEVLVSSTVRDLVSGSGIGFSDRGVHALKGIPEEWRIFAVDSPA